MPEVGSPLKVYSYFQTTCTQTFPKVVKIVYLKGTENHSLLSK